MVNNCINNILSRLFQTHCPLCEAPSDGQLCQGCHQDIPLNRYCCTCCALPLPELQYGLCGHCLSTKTTIDHSLIPFRYAEPVDHLIGQFKFASNLPLGRLLSQLWLAHVDSIPDRPELLIPIPLHATRLRERGYNQALELAKLLGRQFNIPIDQYSCERIIDNPPQARLKKQQRKKNIRGAFSLRRPIDARHIALVDDVVTTGSTVTELARLLKRSGVERVDVWALARTP
jgi:ComF family protein